MCHNVVMWVQQVSALNKYQSTPNYATLPHFGGLEWLRTAHIAAMMLKVLLCQSFHESISNLVFGVNRGDLDESLAHMFTKMMIANAYVLGSWTQLWKPREFKSALVVFKYFTVDIRLSANDLEVLLPHFLQQVHNRNDVMQHLMYLASVVDSAT